MLMQMGTFAPSDAIIELGRNLFNLQLIGSSGPHLLRDGGANILDELDLWERSRESFEMRESGPQNPGRGKQLVAEAIRLATAGLNEADRSFGVEYPLNDAQHRLASESWIVLETTRIGRFVHEKLQEYLYSWDAAEHRKMPRDVLREIPRYRTRNILPLVASIYRRQNLVLYERFLTETLYS